MVLGHPFGSSLVHYSEEVSAASSLRSRTKPAFGSARPSPCGRRTQPPSGPALSAACRPYNILYNHFVKTPKPVEFRGSALDDLRAFPLDARREAGHQIDQAQNGRDPDDWRPMPTVGKGVREIRVRDATGAFRVIYVAKLADAVYVLHCFQKKTQKTSKSDLDLAGQRYRDLLKELER